MKVFQDTQDVQYLQSIMEKDEQKSRFIQQYLNPLLHSGINRILKGIKIKGFDSLSIIQFLALLPLMGLYTIAGVYPSEYSAFVLCKKDVFYRLKNNPNIPWRKLLYSIARRFFKLGEPTCLQSDTEEPKYFIFDDTDVQKTGQKIEGVGRIYSHVQHISILGYKLLVLGVWDGLSFIPVDFSIHREKGKKKNRLFGLLPEKLAAQFTKKRAENQPAYERKKELDSKKTDSVIKMMKTAIKQGIKANFVLCDSWFFNFDLLDFAVKKAMTLISGVKMGKINFTYNGKKYSPKALLNLHKRKAKFSRKLKIHYVALKVEYKGIKIKLFFVRYSGQSKWRIIMNSDTKMSFIKTMEHYQIRWTIEVFFKETKQYLGLSKCQSNDFDAHIAHISITCILFMALALKKRVDCHQTIGGLFREAKVEMNEHTLATKMWVLFCKIIQSLSTFFDFEPKMFLKKVFNESVSEAFDNLVDNKPLLV
jgi:hypothetical protein